MRSSKLLVLTVLAVIGAAACGGSGGTPTTAPNATTAGGQPTAAGGGPLKVNSEFDIDAGPAIAEQLFQKRGTMLLVWQHEAIPALALALGASNPPKWKNKDFDGIWIITYRGGHASLAFDREGISPAATCSF